MNALNFTERAREWEEQAHFLIEWADGISASNAERSAAWNSLFLRLDGPVFGAAHKLVHQSLNPESPETLRAAATILQFFSRILRQLGQLDEAMVSALNRADNLPGGLGSVSPLRRLHAQLRAAAGMVDALCSRNIRALCTPADVLIPQRLEDFADWNVDEIHQYHLWNLTPLAQAALADYPEARILESSEGRLVAIVPPPNLDATAAASMLTFPHAVGTFVGGVGSAQPDSWATGLGRASTLAAASGQPVVAWVGYPAPGSLREGIQSRSATIGAAELARFQSALGRRYPHARRTVVGYSYGSVVAAKAAETSGESGFADSLVFLGSPGIPLRQAADLPGRVFASTNPGDPIGLLGGSSAGLHGNDPAHPAFGAHRLERDGEYGHLHYFDDERLMHAVGEVIVSGRVIPSK